MEDFNPDLRIVLDFFIYGADQKNRSDSDNELLFELAKEYIPSLGCRFQEKYEIFDARIVAAYRIKTSKSSDSGNYVYWFLSFLQDLVIKVNCDYILVDLMHNFICISLVLGVAKRFLSQKDLDDLKKQTYHFMFCFLHINFSELIRASGGFQALLQKRKDSFQNNFCTLAIRRIFSAYHSVCLYVRSVFNSYFQ